MSAGILPKLIWGSAMFIVLVFVVASSEKPNKPQESDLPNEGLSADIVEPLETATPTATQTPIETTKAQARSPTPAKTTTPIPIITATPTKTPIPTPLKTPTPTTVLLTKTPTPLVTVISTPQCHPSYEGACLKMNAGDYDCIGGSGDGPNYTGKVYVVGPDVFGLDRDHDGIGCE